MRGYIKALGRERERNLGKAKWLRRGYLVVLLGLCLVALAATVATLDRYVLDEQRHSNHGRCVGKEGREFRHQGTFAASLRLASVSPTRARS